MSYREITCVVRQHSKLKGGEWSPVVVTTKDGGGMSLEPADVSYASWFLLAQTPLGEPVSILVRVI